MLWNGPFLPWISILKLAGLMIGLAVLCGPCRLCRANGGPQGQGPAHGTRDFTAALLVWRGRANPRSRRFAPRRLQARLRGAFRQNECENESLSLGRCASSLPRVGDSRGAIGRPIPERCSSSWCSAGSPHQPLCQLTVPLQRAQIFGAEHLPSCKRMTTAPRQDSHRCGVFLLEHDGLARGP
jgi:hypothetical protein